MHDLTCTACSAAIESLIVLYNTGVSYEAFSEAAVAICNVFLDEFVCQGALNNYFVSIDVTLVIMFSFALIPKMCATDCVTYPETHGFYAHKVVCDKGRQSGLVVREFDSRS